MQNPYSKYQNNQAPPKKPKAQVPLSVERHKKPMSKPKIKKVSSKGIQGSLQLITVSFLGLALSFYILFYTDEFLSQLNRIELSFSTSHAQDGAKNSSLPIKKGQEISTLPVGGVSGLSADVDELTMKNSSVYKALKDKQGALEKKERDLARLEEDLQLQRVEIEKQLLELKEMRRTISSKLDSKVIADQESVDKLVGVYSNMKPQNAATIISQLDEQLAVKVLGKMKPQNAAAVLNFMEPQKAQTLSEKYAGLKR